MKTTLTDEQINRYQDDGCLVVKEFLNESERNNLLEAINTAVATMGKQKIAGSNARNFPEKEGFYDKVFLQRLNLWKISPFIRNMFTGQQLGESGLKSPCQLGRPGGPAMKTNRDVPKQRKAADIYRQVIGNQVEAIAVAASMLDAQFMEHPPNG